MYILQNQRLFSHGDSFANHDMKIKDAYNKIVADSKKF